MTMKMLTKTNTILTIVLIAMSFGTAISQTGSSLNAIAWLPGCWAGEQNIERFEERWMTLVGGAMLGVSRTVRDGKMTEFEFMQIREQNGSAVYIAQPQGHRPVTFKLLRLNDNEAIFENPDHDFPQRIIYRHAADGSLFARIEGTTNGKTMGFDFPMKRVKCE